MGRLTTAVSKALRNSPNLYKIPPYLSLLCMLGGIIWILLLPLNQYSRQTYISENALLPGQVHTYFAGSEENVFRAYRHELSSVLLPPEPEGEQIYANKTFVPSQTETSAKIDQLFRNAGLKTAKQTYSYISSGKTYAGENVYAVLHAPRGDGTEAIVLVAALKNIQDVTNLNGVTLLVTLARYFKRWSLWSKDIIFLVTPDSAAGPQAWIDAYHSTQTSPTVADLTLKSGALQGAVCIDYPFANRFETLHVAYDGINGQLPNLDLFNTAVAIASSQMGIGTSIQHMHNHGDSYTERLQTLFRGMTSQALGHATGPHSVFMPYHIDAITLTTVGEGWQDEMALGRTVESTVRSLNNLLEHLHQSFFFYLLMQSNRFVSIGTYLPSAMAVAAGYTIIALWVWWKAGFSETAETGETENGDKDKDEKKGGEDEKLVAPDNATNMSLTTKISLLPTQSKTRTSIPRAPALILPFSTLLLIHGALPSLPLYLSTTTEISRKFILEAFTVLGFFSVFFPIIVAAALPEMPNNESLPKFPKPTEQQYKLMRSLSLLWLGACLTVLATLNFSLSVFLGVACAPIAFVARTPRRRAISVLSYLALIVSSPFGLAAAAMLYATKTGLVMEPQSFAREVLTKVAFGWNVWRSWCVIVGVWAVWWPAWIMAAVGVASTWFDDGSPAVEIGNDASGKKPPFPTGDAVDGSTNARARARAPAESRKDK